MIKDVLVHLDGGEGDELRLQHAEAIAVISAAHLTGLFTNPLADITAVVPIDGGAAAAQVSSSPSTQGLPFVDGTATDAADVTEAPHYFFALWPPENRPA